MNTHGFTLIQETQLEEMSSLARVWLHEKSGAQCLSLCNNDENKVFGVVLRTPPHDSTGLPHILEHSVLCGSAKYPVKEPFVELLKGSLQTFLNAFTYPDKTCYPVASANLQDFYNLIDVYLDAVFHPLINAAIFQQEGWHLDAAPRESGDGKMEIVFKGVVYNEMKGVFSSPEAVMERESMHALFPDTPYGYESGGDPSAITTLTYRAFQEFHKKYYHPSNARFFFWGDDPEEKRLEILGELLAPYSRINVEDSVVPLQRSFDRPKSLRLPYASGDDVKSMYTMNWVLNTVGESPEQVENILAMAMLEHILLGMPASPLRRALIESGLGEDLAGSGMVNELRQMTFSVGLKGIEEKNAAQVEEIIFNTLKQLANGGLPRGMVEAAINSVEFALRENNAGHYPVGLSVMLRSLVTWLHSDDPASYAPLATLRFEPPLKAIKDKCASGPGYFEGIIRSALIENMHRASIVLYPDKDMEKWLSQEESKRLHAKIKNLSQADKQRLIKATRLLQKQQATPDTPEALATIPRLSVGDLPAHGQEIPQEIMTDTPVPTLFHPQDTNGICYLGLHMDLRSVPEELLPLAPILGRAMLEMGSQDKDFAELNLEIARKTGGIDSDINILTHTHESFPIGLLSLGGKATPDKYEEFFALMSELLLQTRLDDQQMMARMLLEEKARLEHSLVPSGHLSVAVRLKAGLSASGLMAEQTHGISYLSSIRALAGEAMNDWPSLLAKLEQLRNIVTAKNSMFVNITAQPRERDRLIAMASSLTGLLPERSAEAAQRLVGEPPRKEALIAPAQVNYVGKGVNIFQQGYYFNGAFRVVLKHLRTGYLWEKIRVQGGAYGGFISLDKASGDLVFSSYRDPNIEKTLDIIDATADYLCSYKPSQREIDTAIVGAIGEIDAHMLPDAKGHAAFVRAACGETAEDRERLRQEILAAGPDDFANFGEMLADIMPEASTVVLGGSALEEYAAANGWTVNRVI